MKPSERISQIRIANNGGDPSHGDALSLAIELIGAIIQFLDEQAEQKDAEKGKE